MAFKVNLLPQKGAREIVRQRWLGRLRRGSLVMVGVYAAMLTGVFGANLVIRLSLDKLKGQVRQAETAVEALASVESQQVVVKSKLQAASRILGQQKAWSQLVAEVMDFVPDPAAVSDITLTDKGELKVSVETQELQELAVMLNALFKIGSQREFVKNVYLERVEKASNGGYGFTLVFAT